jgi:hypothetical protein
MWMNNIWAPHSLDNFWSKLKNCALFMSKIWLIARQIWIIKIDEQFLCCVGSYLHTYLNFLKIELEILR